jgi:hypothetical protein
VHNIQVFNSKSFESSRPFQAKMKADAVELGEGKSSAKRGALNRGVSILDFILRVVAIMGTLGSAIAMGTTNQTLPFVTQFVRFRAEYSDLPMFTYVFLFKNNMHDFHISTIVHCAYIT